MTKNCSFNSKFGPCAVNIIQFNMPFSSKVRHNRAKMAINQSTHKMQSNGTKLPTDTNLTTIDHSPLNRKSGELRVVHHRNILHANHNCNRQRVASELLLRAESTTEANYVMTVLFYNSANCFVFPFFVLPSTQNV